MKFVNDPYGNLANRKAAKRQAELQERMIALQEETNALLLRLIEERTSQ